MNIEKIVNVVGVFAVIASLIFVGLELRLTRQLAIIDTEWPLMNNYASWNESVLNAMSPVTTKKWVGSSIGGD